MSRPPLHEHTFPTKLVREDDGTYSVWIGLEEDFCITDNETFAVGIGPTPRAAYASARLRLILTIARMTSEARKF